MNKNLDLATKILLVIGGLNWGLVGLTSFGGVSYNWDVVALILGGLPWLAAIVYILIGLAGLYALTWFKK